MSGSDIMVELDTMLKLLPPKSPTLTPLKAMMGLSPPALDVLNVSADLPQSVKRIE